MDRTFKRCPQGHYYQSDECPYCNTAKISTRAQDLYDNPCVTLYFDESPDHIKRVVCVDRGIDSTRLDEYIANLIDRKIYDIPKEVCRKIDSLKDSVNQELLHLHIAMHSGNGFGDYYILGLAKAILPGTLLSQILGKTSKLDALYDWRFASNNESVKCNTCAVECVGDEEFESAKESITSQKHLGVSIKDNSMAIIDIKQRLEDNEDPNESPSFINDIRPYHSEDITLYDPTVVIKNHGEIVYEHKFHEEDYAKILTEWRTRVYQLSVSYKVGRQRIAQILLTLFNRVSELHDRGIVHCDIKPQNILSLKDGLSLIDSLDVRGNGISVGFTPNYCAPEQILARPVSPATDIYNLGLIILSLVNGVMYGETAEFVIPIGNDKTEKIKLLTKASIYLDNRQGTLSDNEAMSNWRSFLEKCLAVEAHDRFANMSRFSKEYQRLIEHHPLSGYIEFSPNFGRIGSIYANGTTELIYKLNASN